MQLQINSSEKVLMWIKKRGMWDHFGGALTLKSDDGGVGCGGGTMAPTCVLLVHVVLGVGTFNWARGLRNCPPPLMLALFSAPCFYFLI